MISVQVAGAEFGINNINPWTLSRVQTGGWWCYGVENVFLSFIGLLNSLHIHADHLHAIMVTIYNLMAT